MTAVELTVVTVLYRSAGMLAETLPTWVRSAEGLPVRFVFADNWPEDGCAEIIAGCLDQDRYRYLPDSSNPGFAAGCNRAVAATTTGHVLLLNPDVWLPDGALARICAAVAEDPGTPVAVGLAMHGGEYVGIDLNPVSLFIDRSATTARAPLGPSGGAAVFPTELYRRFGGFYEHLFAWGEDADLALRLHASGVRTRALDLMLPHAGGHSVDGDDRLQGFRAFLLARNRLLVAARTLTWPLLLVALPVLALAHVALAARRARQGLLRPFLRGVGHGLRQGPAARRQWTGKRFGFATLLSYLTVRRA
ncbi:N-acetylglucosaminyl-diphospho-decaprenol L-rhamnosyltransferase [Micromonospora sp. H404/HB375]|uniref:glycosyltransferase family 2 protein n=1 Tax=Micromonospora chalcea TaxID=1874 RepID=UPI000CE541F9|nr:N-acetylglucosaminyl-diphospho-decaprenol L-rhamnosyltransferase [Micromonospora sp. H404/HB375]PPA58514.1 glycosyl transferase family 2 [Micromonospora chalcea]